MKRIKTDVLVIGAGSGGLSVAAGASQMGASVVLLESGEMGGDCLNYGCVPSKALLAAAKMAHLKAGSAAFGVAAETPQVNYGRVMEHVAETIATIAPIDSQDRFERLGVRVIRACGKFISPREVEAGSHVITARRIVIATGSYPAVPPIPGLDDVPFLTNETLWSLREAPRHLLIIGGGPVGMEMAQAHVRLRCPVTVIEGGQLLGRDDPELTAMLRNRLAAEGVAFAVGAAVTGLRQGGGGIEVATEDGRTYTGSHLLMATGRRANIAGLGLEAAGIKTTATGIRTDAGLRTSNRRVYAIGDAAGGLQFTHVAGYHAGVIVRSMLFGLPSKAATHHIPRVTYTDPELAQVGLTEAEARKEYGNRVEVARFKFDENDRAVAERKTTGFIKVMVVRGRPVGVSVVGAGAGELIALWALVLANRLKMRHVAAMVAPYPTIGEVNKRAAGAYFSPRLFESRTVKRAVGLVQRWLP